MKTYEALRKRVYEIIYPDGMPFTIGCDFVIGGNMWRIHYRRREPNDYRLTISWDWVLSDYRNDMILHMKQNLWPDLTLQSILRALRMKAKRNFNLEMCIALDLHIAVDEDIIEYETGQSVREQPEKVLKQFLSLLTEWENLESYHS